MRKVNIGTSKFTKVLAVDKPGEGGASHEYEIVSVKDKIDPIKIRFQKGPIKEAGINGCHHEDLIAIVIDRLRSFQNSEFSCYENKRALLKLKEALLWLNCRTVDRQRQGVEGTSLHRNKEVL